MIRQHLPPLLSYENWKRFGLTAAEKTPHLSVTCLHHVRYLLISKNSRCTKNNKAPSNIGPPQLNKKPPSIFCFFILHLLLFLQRFLLKVMTKKFNIITTHFLQ